MYRVFQKEWCNFKCLFTKKQTFRNLNQTFLESLLHGIYITDCYCSKSLLEFVRSQGLKLAFPQNPCNWHSRCVPLCGSDRHWSWLQSSVQLSCRSHVALSGGSLTPPASDHPVWQGGWWRQIPWQPLRTSSLEGSSLGYGVPSHERYPEKWGGFWRAATGKWWFHQLFVGVHHPA